MRGHDAQVVSVTASAFMLALQVNTVLLTLRRLLGHPAWCELGFYLTWVLALAFTLTRLAVFMPSLTQEFIFGTSFVMNHVSCRSSVSQTFLRVAKSTGSHVVLKAAEYCGPGSTTPSFFERWHLQRVKKRRRGRAW